MYKEVVTTESTIACPYCGNMTTVPNANAVNYPCNVCNQTISFFDNDMSLIFHRAEQCDEITEVVRAIRKEWIQAGRPQHGNITTTGVYGINPYMKDYEQEDESVAKRFNLLVDMLYDLVDVFHIGSGIWYTHLHNDIGWNAYSEKAEEIIKEYISESLWEEVCRNANS